jgi:ribosomal protein S18 acetylase RimI-like enzyme
MFIENAPVIYRDLDITSDSEIENAYLLYKKVFARAPWHESVICGRCEQPQGLDYYIGQMCPNECSVPLEEMYKPQQTKDALLDEATMFLAVAKVAQKEDGPLIGMSLGYVESYNRFVQTKYSQSNQRIIASVLKNVVNPELPQDKALKQMMAYGSEVLVDPDCQENGVGTRLTAYWSELADENGLDLFLRTNQDSAMAAIALKRLRMMQVLGQKVIFNQEGKLDTDKKVVINALDPANPARILMRRPSGVYIPSMTSDSRIASMGIQR